MSIPEVLVVEDNTMDVTMLEWTMRETGCEVKLTVFADGDLALDYFRDNPTELPDLVILDLNLPRIGGHEVLTFIRQTERLHHLPVVILSSSPTDVMRSQAHTANGFFKKPAGLEGYREIGRSLCETFLRDLPGHLEHKLPRCSN